MTQPELPGTPEPTPAMIEAVAYLNYCDERKALTETINDQEAKLAAAMKKEDMASMAAVSDNGTREVIELENITRVKRRKPKKGE